MTVTVSLPLLFLNTYLERNGNGEETGQERNVISVNYTVPKIRIYFISVFKLLNIINKKL